MAEKADSELVRRQNRRNVLDQLRKRGPLARIDLGRLTGLSPASITAISAQLIDDQVIEELNDRNAVDEPIKRGRPTVRLGLQPHAAHVLAAKISINECEFALADFTGAIVSQRTIETPTYDTDPARFGHDIAVSIRQFIRDQQIDPQHIARIGIAVQGLADTKRGAIRWSPILRTRNIPLTTPIEALVGVRCFIGNDANMIAEGLAATGNYNSGITAVIFTGHGVGMGLIINGEVYHGATGSASEFGHMNHLPGGALCRCGMRGCVEAYAADYGIMRLARSNSEDATPPMHGISEAAFAKLLDAAEAGSPTVVRALERAGEALGYGIARMIALLNPDRVVIGGPATRAFALTEPALRRALKDGVVEDLRQGTEIKWLSIGTDMIITGTIAAALQVVDREIFGKGPFAGATRQRDVA